ncbi:UDP-N-acetylmuramate--L-alanine ligase [Desulforamulus aquiferis]|uniref:UDP-N-acetylmuramate--L-alanine ligase n=1 Tax=Desulforamulus aquiferis TaxID=1397668 RepID=A0AAW7ZFG5_9FIRM|nr:UDP-N-acetylmuramate--L-alanine ligase [Desulforamulus aquiferis]MDO7788008.1 UDP-N-acetylmuramate--L-alanine ligase [Desulforamulus aquiferis]
MQVIEKGIHFVGIGGAGMSGIATVLLGMGGYRISGSDLKRSAVTERLESLGAVCYIGHAPENLKNVDIVVVSTAISPDNPEVQQARNLGLQVLRRGEMLAWLMREKTGVAIAGAHGKTTTTSMAALVLENNGLDPTILIGGDLSNIGGNAKKGQGDLLIAEADESDGSFLLLDPTIAIVTNIEDDHLDHYGTKENIIAAFKEFLSKIPDKGLAILCQNDPVLRAMGKELNCRLITYGTKGTGADYTLGAVNFVHGLNRGEVLYHGDKLGDVELHVPGQHNLLNSLAAIALGRYLNLDFEDIARALKEFRGAKRRYQLLGEIDGVKVVDDYAHHPTEIKATLQAARNSHPGRIITVFQPHRYTRTRQLFREFGESFQDSDIVILTDIYAASEAPIDGVNTQLIIDAIPPRENQQIIYLSNLEKTVKYLESNVAKGDLVLTMGAGDVWTLGRELLRRLG